MEDQVAGLSLSASVVLLPLGRPRVHRGCYRPVAPCRRSAGSLGGSGGQKLRRVLAGHCAGQQVGGQAPALSPMSSATQPIRPAEHDAPVVGLEKLTQHQNRKQLGLGIAFGRKLVSIRRQARLGDLQTEPSKLKRGLGH